MEIVLCISICNSPGTLGLWSMMFTRLLISVYIFILALCAKKIVFLSNFHEKFGFINQTIQAYQRQFEVFD